MAGFIALLIVVGTMSLFVGKPSEARLELRRDHCNEINLFFCNLYVVTWQYYQQLEPKVLKELIENRPRQLKSLTSDYKFEEVVRENAQKLYGEDILYHCIKKAFEELRARGYPVYRLNSNSDKRCDPEYAFVLLTQHEKYDIEPDLSYYESMMKKPWDFYDWEAGKNAYGEFPTQCVPHFSDQRTIYFPTIVRDAVDSHDSYCWESMYKLRRNDRTKSPPELSSVLFDLERLEEGDSCL